MSAVHISLSGNKYGRLTAIERAEDHISCSGRKYIMYRCVCDCGNETVVRANHLKDGTTLSCGCLFSEIHSTLCKNLGKETFTHKMTNSRIYKIWSNLINRCTNPNNPAYKNYGGRGIRVCDEWIHSFESFYSWAFSAGYNNNLTIDRINNDDGYAPENCRWVDRVEQSNNKRNNKYIEYDGLVLTIAEWARRCGIPYKTLHRRINSLHWDIPRALTEPVNN